MKRFELHVASTLEDALQYLARYGGETEVLAGGTDLVVKMREGRIEPRRVLDISRLEVLRGVQKELGGTVVRVGALTSHSQLICSPVASALIPLLVFACRTVGAVQIRNRGTIGGNCITASPAGDTIPALMALEAEMILLSASGERRVKCESFFTGPGRTVRRVDELLGYILVPAQGQEERSVYLKLGQRNALAISVASVALRLIRVRQAGSGLLCDMARVAFGALSPTVVRGRMVEEALAGEVLDLRTINRAASLARYEVSPITDIRGSADYRREMAVALVKRGLECLALGEARTKW